VIGSCEPGARITVQSRRVDEGWAEFSVEGRGEGLGRDCGPRVFKPFAELNPQPQGRSGDLGLTLPLLKRTIMAHGGVLQVNTQTSEHLDFTAGLPLAAPPASRAEAA
jgi:K+-sensing histidine kinase KdpD